MPKPDVSTERRAQILAAASDIFLKKGFDAARMEEGAMTATTFRPHAASCTS